MNSWWLRLYTIPHIQSFLIRTSLVFAINFLVTYLAPFTSFFANLLLAYPVYLIFRLDKEDLIFNLEFHKMNIPFKDLQRALYLDMTITLFVNVGFFITGIVILSHLNPFFASIFKDEMHSSPSVMMIYMLALISISIFVKAMAPIREGHKKNQQDFWKSKKGKMYSFLGVILGFVILFFVMPFVDLIMTRFNEMFIELSLICVFMSVSVMGSIAQRFHRVKSTEHMKLVGLFMKQAIYPGVVVAGICGLAYLEFRSDWFPQEMKANTFTVFSDFSPELTPEDTRDYLKMMPEEAQLIFSRASHEIWQRPFYEIYSGTDLSIWAHYLDQGRPLPQNVVWMTERIELDKDKEAWESVGHYKFVRLKLAQYSPEARDLPEKLKPKINTSAQRLPASTATPPRYRSSQSP